MNIGVLDKICLILKVYIILVIRKLRIKDKLRFFLNPIEGSRYVEFCFLLKSLKKEHILLKNKTILDASSPFILSYILSQNATAVKTDISIREKEFIYEDNRLRFQQEDLTALSFQDNQFDFVYSISVVEHIYEQYMCAIAELIRVTKKGGYIYLSFPVSSRFREEWLLQDVYGNQYRDNEKVFFQYVFDQGAIQQIRALVAKDAKIINEGLYFDKKQGEYERLVSFLRRKKPFAFLRDSVAQLSYGIFGIMSKPQGFASDPRMGVACILICKK